MKTLLLALCIIMHGLFCYAQRSPDFITGLSYPVVNNITLYHSTNFSLRSFPGLFVEKPIPLKINRNDKITINPGLSFDYFNEDQFWGNENVGGTRDLNHLSFNGYGKLLFRQKIKKRNEAFVYFGGAAGVHLFTRTLGSVKALSNNVENPVIDEKINKKANDFFNSFYYGAILGFHPNYRISNRYRFSFEISFFPDYVFMANENANSLFLSFIMSIKN